MLDNPEKFPDEMEEDDTVTARDVRWRVWAVEQAIEIYRTASYDQFYTEDFMDLADRLYRWVARLDNTALDDDDDEDDQDEVDPAQPKSMAEAAVSALAIVKYREKKTSKDNASDALGFGS